MSPPAPRPKHDPALYLPVAHLAIHWPDVSFDDAMRCPTRRAILEYIAATWPRKRTEMIVSIHRIGRLATEHAAHYPSAEQANPYPPESPAGGLYARCFDAQKDRLAQAQQALPAIETIVSQPLGEAA